ncbi:MAG: HAD-IIIC family phosphatase [Gemmatimonadaceae bacterium]
MSDALRVLVVADFNATNVEVLLGKSVVPRIEALGTPLGNVYQTLLAPPAADAAFVWTRPEAVIPSFAALEAHEPVSMEAILAEVDSYVDLLLAAQRQVKVLLVSTWTTPWYRRGLGMLDLKAAQGGARAVLAMNHRLVERLANARDVFVLDAQRWAQAAGPRGDSPQGWYLGKMPYGMEMLKAAVSDVMSALRGLKGGARKLVVVDLDDTLWGGIVGDVGWEGVALGGHDAVGEAHQDFQRGLQVLARRGIVLAIASKNDEAVALEAIRSHPEMVLREKDFAAWRINWRDKATGIAEIAEELNLGLQHVVFLDDNPSERGRVRESLPEVLVPEWPADPRLYKQALLALDCFDTPAITDEDRQRGAMYVAERERQVARQSVASVEDWLASLELTVTVERVRPATLARATQLLNKTNQMNLTTRRLSEGELAAWAAEPENAFWTVSVADRFGEAGLTGLVGVQVRDGRATVEDFVLSCRVFGRQVEETMLHIAASHAASFGASELVALLTPTKKNKPTREFFHDRSGMTAVSETEFRWTCDREYPVPMHVTLQREESYA